MQCINEMISKTHEAKLNGQFELIPERIFQYFLSWQFITTTNMVDDQKLHGIFLVNPIDLKALAAQFVRVTLVNGEVLTGTLYTVDPVSESLVLILKDASDNLSLKIILKHSINSLETLSEVPKEQQNVIVDEIFKSNKSNSVKVNTKEDVKNWLIKNMIPVVEDNDKLIIDSLEIHPPYGVDQCYSDNSIVLSRVKHLLTQMPSKSLS